MYHQLLSQRIRLAQAILGLLTLSAVVASLLAVGDIQSAPNDYRVTETWRMLGLLTFAGLFGILAAKPTGNRILWLVVIFNKFGLAVAGLLFLNKPYEGAADLALHDSVVTGLLVVAFWLGNKREFEAKNK